LARPLRHTVIAIFRNFVPVWQIGKFADIDAPCSIWSFPLCRHNRGKLIPIARTSHARLWLMNEIRGWIPGWSALFRVSPVQRSTHESSSIILAYPLCLHDLSTSRQPPFCNAAISTIAARLYNTVRRTIDVTLLTSHVELACYPCIPHDGDNVLCFASSCGSFLFLFFCTPIGASMFANNACLLQFLMIEKTCCLN